MTIREPSLFFRALILGAQGVFYNLFCKTSPSPAIEHISSCHVQSLPILFHRVLVTALLGIWKKKQC